MVVIIVYASYVVGERRSVVVIHRSALILCVYILEHYVAYPRAIFEVHLHAEHHVLQVVEQKLALFLLLPLVTAAVAVVVDEEHGGVVFKILVGVYAQTPAVTVVVHAHEP